VAPLLAALPGAEASDPRLVALAPEMGDVLDLARTLRPLPGFEPILPVTGIARAARLLAAGAVRTLAATPRDALKLTEMSRLKLASVPVVVLLWPELVLAAGDGALLDSLLAEAAGAQRLIVTSDDGPIASLLERHARRAPLAVFSRPPEQPQAAARFAVVDADRRVAAIRGILDTLNPASALLWEPAPDRYERWIEFAEDPAIIIADHPPADRRVDVAIATELPSAEVLAELGAGAAEVIVLVRATQVSYLQRIAKPLKSLLLAGAADRARERAHALRQSVRRRIEEGDVSSELLALGPLFDEYDPAIVAAALARGVAPPASAPDEPEVPTWVRIQVTVGKRDRARPADLVGALLNGVGLPKDHVGKVDIRDGFSIVEVRAEDLQRVMRALAGLKVRGKSLGARIAN
jgi:ATP-dependent RNA helicase DeaD